MVYFAILLLFLATFDICRAEDEETEEDDSSDSWIPTEGLFQY